MTATVSGIHLSGTHAARPAAAGPPAGSLYSCTTDDLIYRTDGTSWSTWANLTGTGIAAALADAAGDMLVASAADTWAKLTLGAAGGAVSRVNGAVAWNSGTSFPTAATGDRYWRTDLRMEFFYDGTRWLSTTLYTVDGVLFGATASNNGWGGVAFDETGPDMWLEDWEIGAAVITTHDATNDWTLAAYTLAANGTGGSGTTLATIESSALAAGLSNFTSDAIAIDAVLDVSVDPAIRFYAVKNSSAGELRAACRLTYRQIAT